MSHLEHVDFPTRPKGLTSGEYITTTKRRRSESISQRQVDFQNAVPCKVNIQSLPEDVVLSIASKLTLKEAAQMSVLSSMWRQACLFHPNLCFDTQTVLGSHAQGEGMCSDPSKRVLTINNFIKRVDAILKNHCSSQVNKFAVEFGLTIMHANHIDRWVSFAAASKARVVILDLSPDRSILARDNYEFPLQLFSGQNGSYLQALQLHSVTLGPPPDFCGFANLKALALGNVMLLKDIQHLLSKCCLLEWLSIWMCLHQQSLCVREPLLHLQYLRLWNCNFSGIELHAPNLTTFEYSGPPILMNLNECLKLKTSTIKLNYVPLEYVLTEIPSILPHVETMRVELVISTKMFGFTQSPLKFIRLRHLTVEIDCYRDPNIVFQLAYLLEAAPLLEDLHLNMLLNRIFCSMDLDDIMDRPHYHLKTACIAGFCGNGVQIELAKYILKNASTLEHLILNPGGIDKRYTSPMGERYGRKVAKEKLAPLDMNGVLKIL